MPYGIIQCYLPPGSGDFPAFTPAEAGTQINDPGRMQGWVEEKGGTEYMWNSSSLLVFIILTWRCDFKMFILKTHKLRHCWIYKIFYFAQKYKWIKFYVKIPTHLEEIGKKARGYFYSPDGQTFRCIFKKKKLCDVAYTLGTFIPLSYCFLACSIWCYMNMFRLIVWLTSQRRILRECFVICWTIAVLGANVSLDIGIQSVLINCFCPQIVQCQNRSLNCLPVRRLIDAITFYHEVATALSPTNRNEQDQ